MIKRALKGAALITLFAAGSLAAQRSGTVLTPQPDEGTTRVAQRGANFLEIPVGARSQALGGSLVGLASGADAMYWNPAGLGTTDGLVLAFSYSDLYEDLDIVHNYAAAAIPFAGGGFGISYIRLDSGDIPRTDENFPGGGNPQFGPTFEWTSTAIGLHYGRRLTDRLQVGVSGRVIEEGITGASASWWGIDVGTIFNTGLYGITFGAALANIGPTSDFDGNLIVQRINTDQAFPFLLPVRFKTTDYQLPLAFRFSIVENLVGGPDALLSANPDHGFDVAVDLHDATDTDLQTAVGIEYNFREFIYLRGGKRFLNELNTDEFREFSDYISFGGGIRIPVFGRQLKFDYAYTDTGELENVQTFSFEFGGR